MYVTYHLFNPNTQSTLRILDCFLLEGHKILFRVCLAILKVNEQHILSLSDPVALFQFLKEVARHTFDVEGLFHVCCVKSSLCLYGLEHIFCRQPLFN